VIAKVDAQREAWHAGKRHLTTSERWKPELVVGHSRRPAPPVTLSRTGVGRLWAPPRSPHQQVVGHAIRQRKQTLGVNSIDVSCAGASTSA